MTEIMPFPENNILFYWAAPQAASFFCQNIPSNFMDNASCFIFFLSL